MDRAEVSGCKKDVYQNAPLFVPKGSRDTAKGVVRGGSWHSGPFHCRSASRLGLVPDHASDIVGFRVVCEVTPPAEKAAPKK